MKLTILCIAIVMLPVAAVALDLEGDFGPTAFSPTVFDAAARGMGRVSITTACLSDAIFYNPANIAMIDKKVLQGGGRIFFGSIDDDYCRVYDYDFDASYEFHPKITHLSYAFPFQPSGTELKLAFGVAYNTYFDYGASIEEEWTALDQPPGRTMTIVHDIRTRGGLNTISPALAVAVNDEFFFGFAFHKSLIGKLSKTTEYEYSLKPYGSDFAEQEHEATGSASFITLGVNKVMTSGLRVGAVYRSGFEFELDDVQKYQRLVDGYEWTEHQSDSEYDIPPYIGVGASYEFSTKFMVAGEFQTRPYGDIEQNGQEYQWIDDGYCYRIGAELRSASMAFRGGFFRDALLATDQSYSDDDPKSLMGITGGLGFKSGTLSFDFFGEYSWWGKEYEYRRIIYDGDTAYDSEIYDRKEKMFTLGATATVDIK